MAKSKATIRKMTPLARKLAHLTRAAKSLTRLLSNFTEELQHEELDMRAAKREVEEMRERAEYWETQHENLMKAATYTLQHEWPDLPNGEGVAGLTESDILLQGPGEGAGYHLGSDADPRD